MRFKMISMGTFEELRSQNHSLGLYCISCDRWGEANLDQLIQIGKGVIFPRDSGHGVKLLAQITSVSDVR